MVKVVYTALRGAEKRAEERGMGVCFGHPLELARWIGGFGLWCKGLLGPSAFGGPNVSVIRLREICCGVA